MKIKITLGRTVNVGNYESVRLDYGIEVEAKPGDTAAQTYEKWQPVVEKQLNAEVKKLEAKLK